MMKLSGTATTLALPTGPDWPNGPELGHPKEFACQKSQLLKEPLMMRVNHTNTRKTGRTAGQSPFLCIIWPIHARPRTIQPGMQRPS